MKKTLTITIAIVMLLAIITQHELIHGQICKATQGTETYEIKIWGVITHCQGEQLNKEMTDHTKMNVLNEIIGYNLLGILAIMLLYPLYLKMLKEDEKR